MAEVNQPLLERKPRIQFIDMARSMAILLMLEGHFVHNCLQLVGVKNGAPVDNIYSGNVVFETWSFIREFTSPIFLTLTGLVFVYLLTMNKEIGFFDNIRVKKGAIRVFQLLCCGYLLQPSAFHILQCIACGLGIIILLYGLFKLIKIIPLWIYFLATGMLFFYSGNELNNLPNGMPWPNGAPGFIQNMFHGPANKAIFPLVPHLGFTMIGAMIGCWMHDFTKHVKKWRFAFFFITLGAILYFFANPILITVDDGMKAVMGEIGFKNISMNWILWKIGMVFMVLGCFMIIEKMVGELKGNLFLKIGQNTLSVFILHAIILYGAITGFGINRFIYKSIGPWEATIGAALFISIHIVFVYYLDALRLQFNKLVTAITPMKLRKKVNS